MSQFYDQASLVMVPSGYKAGKVYSQKPLSTDGELTFTRNSNATRVNADGLVEKVRTNLALYSNDFSNAAWLKSGSTVTAGYSDPHGGINAFKVDISAGGNHYLYQGITMPAGTKTVSCWIKADSAISIGFSVGGSTPNAINLTTSWTRFSFVTTDTSGGVFFGNYFGPTPAQEAKTFYVYQSQLEVSDFGPTQYIPTTSAAVSVGATANTPRLDYSGGGCSRLILEPQRTNLALWSEQIDNAGWSKLQLSVSANASQSPTGYTDADKLVPNTTNTTHIVYQTISAGAGTYTASAFFKADGYNYGCIRLSTDADAKRYAVVIDLTTGAVTATDSYGSPTGTAYNVTSYGNGWWRLSVTAAHTTSFMYHTIGLSSTAVPTFSNSLPSFAGDGTKGVLMWGSQLELGSYETSLIPSLGASVTRLADAAYKTGISSLIGQTEGTVFLDTVINGNTNPILLQLIPNTVSYSSSIYVEYVRAINSIRTNFYDSGVLQASFVKAVTIGTRYKIAFAYKANDFVLYVDGVQIATDTSGTVQSGLQDLFIGCLKGSLNAQDFNGNTLNQALLFKTRLTNAQLAELTAL